MSPPLPPLARNEEIKAKSDFLRGTLADELNVQAFGGISEDSNQLVKFHGMYVQDDRDLRPERTKRKLDRAYMFMARLRIPAGVITPRQYLALDRIATERANGTLRLTTRQTVQFHGIIKSNVRAAMQAIDHALLDTIAACGDVNRNVMSTSNPYLSCIHAEATEAARQLSAQFLPHTGAWREIFIGDERVLGGAPENEPVYGATYLPRKFKMAVAVPPSNDVDVFAQDLGFIAIAEKDRVAGYNVVVGGGMGATHGESDTYPRIGDIIGYVPAAQLLEVAEAVLTTQRDFGDRTNRKHARLKYTIDTYGLDWFCDEVNRRMHTKLHPSRPFEFQDNGDGRGWITDSEGLHHYTLFVENGRISDGGDQRLKSALVEISRLKEFIDSGTLVMTPNQSIIIARATQSARDKITKILDDHSISKKISKRRETAMACVALPTCGLALAEAERYLPDLITKIDALLAQNNLTEQQITIRMTGCPNGCARPYLAEIGLVGRNPGRYNLMLGGAADGTRLNRLYRENADETEILKTLETLFFEYTKNAQLGERFGDYTNRAGMFKR